MYEFPDAPLTTSCGELKREDAEMADPSPAYQAVPSPHHKELCQVPAKA